MGAILRTWRRRLRDSRQRARRGDSDGGRLGRRRREAGRAGVRDAQQRDGPACSPTHEQPSLLRAPGSSGVIFGRRRGLPGAGLLLPKQQLCQQEPLTRGCFQRQEHLWIWSLPFPALGTGCLFQPRPRGTCLKSTGMHVPRSCPAQRDGTGPLTFALTTSASDGSQASGGKNEELGTRAPRWAKSKPQGLRLPQDLPRPWDTCSGCSARQSAPLKLSTQGSTSLAACLGGKVTGTPTSPGAEWLDGSPSRGDHLTTDLQGSPPGPLHKHFAAPVRP